MQCSNCQSDNARNARFCSQCGAKLGVVASAERPAPSFEETIARIQRYLPQGLTQKILSQRERLEGERRHVTVMFCDMEGFTPLVDRLGAESAYTIMGQIYEILIRQVHDHEGTINEMTGDGIMALFGAPIAIEDAPQRALWAARAIHREIALFNEHNKGLDTIRMRIGINTGPVVVGTLGNDLRVEFKAVGDTVNLASRMESLAEPGTTYVTQAVYDKTREMFALESLGKKFVKGWPVSIPVYKVPPGSRYAHRPRLGSERMIFSEMVGRKGMLETLEHQIMKLVHGAGSIINLIGEAGIGKSRLLAELKRRDALRHVTLLEGQAISMGRNLSFHPIIDLLKRWARIDLNDDMMASFTKLETAVRDLLGHESDDVLPFVATLMGLQLPDAYGDRLKGIEGEALEKLIRKSMRELFARLSRANPLLIVIDDLHWSDASSIELLESLIRLAEHERIMFIGLFRPDYDHTSQRLLAALEEAPTLDTVNLYLTPLDDHESETLIANMMDLRGVRHATVDQIIRRTGGNPYFIEEVVRSFIDQGAVVVRAGAFQTTPKFDALKIPDTINDVIMARIDRLEEETRELLKVAAVIGRRFFYRVLSEVAGTVRNLDERLSFLKDVQLIQEHRGMEELEYVFNHALAQEAAYASILPENRKALHLKVAETIEKVFPEKRLDFSGMLAYHYSRAEDLEKAEETLIKAGEAALRTSASSEALHYYLEALNLYRSKTDSAADTAKVAQLEKGIALAFYNRGQYEEALEYFDRAIACLWGALPKTTIFKAGKLSSAMLGFLTAVYLPWWKIKKTVSPADIEKIDILHKKSKALSIINPLKFFWESICLCREITKFNFSGSTLCLEIYVESSCLFTFTGVSFRVSSKILRTARKMIRRDESKIPLLFDFMETVHNYLGGEWDRIGAQDMSVVQRNLEHGELFIASQYLYWQGCPAIYKGHFGQARTILKELATIAEVYENDFSILLGHLLKIKLLLETRQLDDGLNEIDEAIGFAKKKGFSITLLDLFSCKARIYSLKREIDNALVSLDQADEINETLRAAPIQRSIYLRNKIEVLVLQWAEALDAGRNGNAALLKIKVGDAIKQMLRVTKRAAQHRTEAYRLKGVYYALSGKPNPAFKWLHRSIQEGVRLGARLELSRTYLEMGKRLMLAGGKTMSWDGIRAEEYLDRAEKMFAAMALPWDREQLTRFRNRSDNFSRAKAD